MKQREKKKKMKLSWIRIQTSPSQWLITIKPRNVPLGFSISSLMSPLTTKAHSLRFESKTPWSTARRPKKTRGAQECHLEEGKPQKSTKGKKKRQSQAKWQERAKKSSKSTQKLKRAKKAQNQHKSSKSTLWQWTHQTQTKRRMRCYAWESTLWCFTRHTSMYLSNYIHHHAKTYKIRVNPHKATITG
jgi:hypothetical protein